MISIFKNFYVKPAPLSSDKAQHLLQETVEKYNDGTRNLSDFLPTDASKVFNHKDVRLALEVYYHEKCAYCEQKISTSASHYRPKSRYPWLAFEWSNLLPMCKECNNSLSNKFETKGSQLSYSDIISADNILLANSPFFLKEEALLLHPEVDSPENHIDFDVDGLAIGRTTRGRYTIDRCNLNRSKLQRSRAILIKQTVDELSDITLNSYFKLGGELMVQGMPNDYELFFRKIYDKQKPNNEFSRIHQMIWENLEDLLVNKGDLRPDRVDQIMIWRRLFLRKQERDIKTDHSALLSFQIQNIEGLRDISISNLNAEAKWIFLTGENGYGKSTILKALAAGLAGNDLSNDNFRSNIRMYCPRKTYFNVNLRSIDISQTQEFEVRDFIWQSDRFSSLRNVAAYSSNRIRMSKDYNSLEGNIDHILYDDSELLNIERYLTDIYGRQSRENKFNVVVDTLKQIVPQLAKIEIDDSNDLLEVKYFEYSDDEQHTFTQVRFNQLATGIKSVIGLAGDILCRFLINRDLDDPSEIEGIVIIDEIDVHLHPKWQRELPRLLSKAFPKVQFIASTHSPIPLLGAPEHSVFLTVNRSYDKGVEIDRLNHLEQEIDKLTPNLLLNSEIFGFTDVLSSNYSSAKEIYTENTNDEVEFSKRLEDSLKEKLSEDKAAELRRMLDNNKGA